MTGDYRVMDIESVDRAILDYATKLTRTPAEISQTDVDALRDQGLDDRAIHDLACIVGYFAFVNRLANGLGVEMEDQV